MERSRAFEIIPERATPDDIEPILRIWREAAEWIAETKKVDQWRPGSFDRAAVQRQLNDTELFVVRDRDAIAGTFSVQWADPVIWGELDDGRSGYIHRLIVPRAYGGRQIGKGMLDWAARYVYGKRKASLRLDCMAENEALNRYYRNMGFRYVGRVDKPRFSASLFEKKLPQT